MVGKWVSWLQGQGGVRGVSYTRVRSMVLRPGWSSNRHPGQIRYSELGKALEYTV